MVTFTKTPNAVLNAKTGAVSGLPERHKSPSVGIDTEELNKQAINLVQKKVPLEKALKAVDQHPDITDKPRAKSMVAAVYQILGAKK